MTQPTPDSGLEPFDQYAAKLARAAAAPPAPALASPVPAPRFDSDGRLVIFADTPPEPICPECSEPIRWVLDMYSMVRVSDGAAGRFALAHARCVWLPAAFTRERSAARHAARSAQR